LAVTVPIVFYDAGYCEKSATFSSLGPQALYYFRQLSYVHQFQTCEMTTETAVHFACKVTVCLPGAFAKLRKKNSVKIK